MCSLEGHGAEKLQGKGRGLQRPGRLPALPPGIRGGCCQAPGPMHCGTEEPVLGSRDPAERDLSPEQRRRALREEETQPPSSRLCWQCSWRPDPARDRRVQSPLKCTLHRTAALGQPRAQTQGPHQPAAGTVRRTVRLCSSGTSQGPVTSLPSVGATHTSLDLKSISLLFALYGRQEDRSLCTKLL